MGEGVAGSANAPATQPTNAGNSGAASRAETAAQAEFGRTLAQENLCPEGLHRPSRNDPPCTYLRPPSHPSEPAKPSEPSKPVDIHHYQGNPDDSKGPTTRSTGPDYTKPIAPSTTKEIKPPDGPGHNSGLGSGDGAHIFTWEFKLNRL